MKKYIKENKNRIIILIFSFLFQTSVYSITKLFQGTPMHLNNYFDNMIPFIPAFVTFYVLWYLLLFLIPLLILKYNKKVFDRYIVACLIYALFEGIIFILLPTTMTREPLVVDSISTWIINIISISFSTLCLSYIIYNINIRRQRNKKRIQNINNNNISINNVINSIHKTTCNRRCTRSLYNSSNVLYNKKKENKSRREWYICKDISPKEKNKIT